MSISRRGFIGGIVAAVASGEALVRLASPQEQGLVKIGDPAFLPPDAELSMGPPGAFGRMYVAIIGDKETYEALGWATSVSMHSEVDALMVTEYGMDVQHYRRGLGHRKLNISSILDISRGSPFS